MHALVDGIPAASLSVRDRGLLYGDGLFETIRFRHRQVPLWSLHRRRLQQGLQKLGIALDLALLEHDLQLLWALPGMRDEGVIRITVTRGHGGRGYACAGDMPATRIISVSPLPEEHPGAVQQGVLLRLCQWRLARQPALAGIKHLNRLDQVMARREWDDPAIFDGLLMDDQGCIVESTACNLFMRFGNEWVTPDLSGSGVAGVMRAWLLEKAFPARGIHPQPERITLHRLRSADEVFLCNSVRGVIPVRALQAPATDWPIGELGLALHGEARSLFHG